MTLALYALCSLSICLLALITWRLHVNFSVRSQASEMKTAFTRSADFYRPMARLLAAQDFHFLRSRPEISARSLRRMRSDRRRIFRKYLRSLGLDLAIIMSQLRVVMVESPESRVDLAATLLKSRLLFAGMMIAIECRLFLHACGVNGIAISVTPLTEGLAQMRRTLELFVPQPALAAF
jgi:hypothetical protein